MATDHNELFRQLDEVLIVCRTLSQALTGATVRSMEHHHSGFPCGGDLVVALVVALPVDPIAEKATQGFIVGNHRDRKADL